MSGIHRIDGLVFLEYGLPVKGAAIRLYGKGFGGTETRLGEGKTDEQGHHGFSRDGPDSNPTNVKARTVGPQGKEISISCTKSNPNKVRICQP
jgi:hypothetical protein